MSPRPQLVLTVLLLASCAPLSAAIPEPALADGSHRPTAPVTLGGQTFARCPAESELTSVPGWTYCPASLEQSAVALFDDRVRVRLPWEVRLVEVDEQTVAMEPRAVPVEPCLADLPEGRLHYMAVGLATRDGRPLPEVAHAVLDRLGYPEESCVLGEASDEERGRLRIVLEVPADAARTDADGVAPFARPRAAAPTRGLLRLMADGDRVYYVVAEAEQAGWPTIERTVQGTVGSMVLMRAEASAHDAPERP